MASHVAAAQRERSVDIAGPGTRREPGRGAEPERQRDARHRVRGEGATQCPADRAPVEGTRDHAGARTGRPGRGAAADGPAGRPKLLLQPSYYRVLRTG